MSASWAVVATVDEPAPLVAAFVAHHLNEGAREVHLFLDKPDPETVALIGTIEQHYADAFNGQGIQVEVHKPVAEADTLQTLMALLPGQDAAA